MQNEQNTSYYVQQIFVVMALIKSSRVAPQKASRALPSHGYFLEQAMAESR